MSSQLKVPTTRVFSDTCWVFTEIPEQENLEVYQQVTLLRGVVAGVPIKTCRAPLVAYMRKHLWRFHAVASRTEGGNPPYMYARSVVDPGEKDVIIQVPCMFMHLLYGYKIQHIPREEREALSSLPPSGGR
jgi:hypothetical protein